LLFATLCGHLPFAIHHLPFAIRNSTLTHLQEPSMTEATLNIAQLPQTPAGLFGRDPHLAQLQSAWDSPHTNLLTVLGDDGLGKSTLVNTWLQHHFLPNRPAHSRVFGWSFFNYGSVANQTVAADFFIDAALRWFGDTDPTQGSPWERGRRLAGLIAQQPTLLILDGLELLQMSRGPQAGHLHDPAMQALLTTLAAANPGLAVLTTRLPVTNIEAPTLTLEPLPAEAGAALLQAGGLQADEAHLQQISRNFDGHPLALWLLAGFGRAALAGDLTRLAEIPPLPDDDHRGGQARRVMQAWVNWLGPGPELNVLAMLGLFTRPADIDLLEILRETPPIPHLTNHFFDIKQEKVLGLFAKSSATPLNDNVWDEAVAALQRGHLLLPTAKIAISPVETAEYLDAHPLVRRFFARDLGSNFPKAWQGGHLRLYKHLKTSTEKYPDTLVAAAPLYDALAHACRAGMAEEALEDIFWQRLSRKELFYSTKTLGAFGADLAALANAFSQPWSRPVQSLPKFTWAALLNWTGTALRALGRLDEARQPLETALKTYIAKKDWKQVSIAAVNLSQLNLVVGDVAAALTAAEEGVKRAKRRKDETQRLVALAGLAEAQLQAGQLEAAAQTFAQVEEKQRLIQHHPFLYARRGYFYCDLLLSAGEFEAVLARASQTIEIAQNQGWPLYVALDHLSLGRAYTTQAAANPAEPARERVDMQPAGQHLTEAITGLRQEGAQEFMPPALLARAEWHWQQGHWTKAQTDIDDAMDIARRNGMKPFECEALLGQVRLWLAQGQPGPAAQQYLQQARAIVDSTGCRRREPEIAALTALIAGAG
jgi:tetratricopeptide (TPR) repeat protein